MLGPLGPLLIASNHSTGDPPSCLKKWARDPNSKSGTTGAPFSGVRTGRLQVHALLTLLVECTVGEENLTSHSNP